MHEKQFKPYAIIWKSADFPAGDSAFFETVFGH